MASGSLRRQIGRLLVAGFDGLQLPSELRSLARDFGLGGVILFARNIAEPGQVAELSYEAARLVPDMPVWVSIDQEGGRVARLKAPFTEWPPMATLGRSGDLRLAERFARALAAELRAVGVTLDYAPVLDVHTNSRNPVIGDRALSGKAEEVARFGAALIRTLQAEGIAACGKHFPGHGDTNTDSHLELPLVEHPPERLRQVEFLPFRAAVEARVASIMTAHVLVPSLDEQRPATLSRRTVSGLLREELGYEGVILSDDLEMKAIANEYSVPSAAVLAVEAGCDGVLICSGNHDLQVAALESLIHAVEENRLPFGRSRDSGAQRSAFSARRPSPARGALSARRRSGRCSAVTTTVRWPTRWRGSREPQTPSARARRPPRRGRTGQCLRAGGVRSGHRGNPPAGV
jgi:beta-N-acetylhexosaminidase